MESGKIHNSAGNLGQCLMFAHDLVHDLVLLSPFREGLQFVILHKFCQTWLLTVNMEKTLTCQKTSGSGVQMCNAATVPDQLHSVGEYLNKPEN